LDAALASVLLGLCRIDPTAVLLQLLALHGAAPRDGRRQRELGARLKELRADMPQAHDAAEALAGCCQQLAVAQGAATREVASLNALHERVALDELHMPAAPHATAPLQRIECRREMAASDKLRTSRLLACVDQSGEVHPLLLKARPAAEFNPFKEAVAAQALCQAAALVTGPKGLGPASSPQQIASHVLPLAPAARGDGGFVAAALVHYRSAAFNLEAWLAREHSAAHAAGIDAVTPPVASHMFSDAQAPADHMNVVCMHLHMHMHMNMHILSDDARVIRRVGTANAIGHLRTSLSLPLSLHCACTAPALRLHCACTAPALRLHCACTAPALRLHCACTA
jgi:hypothetical protein